ncbi:MAG: dihydroorotase [Alphaproteobacteria bacterium]
MPALIQDHLKMGCAGILAMPNTKPPVAKVFAADPLPCWSIEEYLAQLLSVGGEAFENMIVPLYLTQDTTPAMIEAGAKSGILKACKYYPPHGTTGSEHGRPFTTFIDNGVFAAMEATGVVLCVHGEEHGLPGEDYFSRSTNAEELFYRERMPRAADKFSKLKIVCEHVTTKVAADFVAKAGDNIAASVTPQHLIYTVGHLVQGLKYHLFCMPLVKFADDRDALRAAVISSGNRKFFAGTDSAPHAKKVTPCGCAAGCYTGGIAPQLYAEAFEMAGADFNATATQEAFKNFLCFNGPAFYGFAPSKETFTLTKTEQKVGKLKTPAGDIVPLPLGMKSDDAEGPVTMAWSIA